MEFEKALAIQQAKIRTVFDLAAFCYDYLAKHVGSQEMFVGKYIMKNENADMVNPNLKKLERFSRWAEQTMWKRKESGILFSEWIAKLRVRLNNFTLEEYGDPFLNEAAVPFFILQAADRYVLEMRGQCLDSSPLNKEYCDGSCVYLNIEDSMLDEAASDNRFSDVIHCLDVRSQLENLIILEKRELPEGVGVPRVVKLWIAESDKKRRKLIAGKELRIAVIPFGKHKMVEFPVSVGAFFRVRYEEPHLDTGVDRALKLLDQAIDRKANIILFPEFICNREMQDAVRRHLQEISRDMPSRAGQLLLVVAGSGWTADDNNVAEIFSYDGQLLGKQYKFSRFASQKQAGKELIEGLSAPGKETTIIEIEGIGKILTGICRDVSERFYTKMLAAVFRPQLLLTPAWSPSVNMGFKEQFREITAENHRTCSVLCNCCEAIHSEEIFKTDTGMVVTPYKEGSVVIGKECMLKRTEECAEQCRDGGCIFAVHIDFHTNAVQNGDMAGWKKYIY